MRTLRFYVPLSMSVGQVLRAPDTTAHHISRVLRLSVDDELTLFNGSDVEFAAVVHAIHKKHVDLRITAESHRSIESSTKIHLIQSVSKGDRMDWVMQKAVELGVTSIHPVRSQRTTVNLAADRLEKKVSHWQGIVNSACEQCGRNFVPQVHPICPLFDVAQWSIDGETPHKIILSPEGEKTLLDAKFSQQEFVLAVGPEGGFTLSELETLTALGYNAYSLGPRILRTETAAISSITLIQAIYGDM